MSVISNECIRKLKAMGISDADPLALDYLADDVQNEIRIYCHRDDVPAPLARLIPDNVCGRYIKSRIADGTLQILGEAVNAAVPKAVTVGDASVTFASGEEQQTTQQRLLSYAEQMDRKGRDLWKCFKKVKWR